MSSSSFHLCCCATRLFAGAMGPSLLCFYFSRIVWTLDAFIPHSAAAHTTPSCLCAALQLLSSTQGGRRGESKGVLFSTLIPDAGGPLVLLEARLAVSQTVTAVCMSFTRSKTLQNFHQLSLHPDLLASAGTLAITENDTSLLRWISDDDALSRRLLCLS